MIVMKFGGTSLGSAERIKSVAEIAKRYIDKKPVLVVSAVGGITDKIIEAAEKAFSDSVVDIETIKEKHKTILKELNLDENLVDEELNGLKCILESVAKLKDNSNKIMDIVQSFGERISSRIIAAYFNSINLKAKNFDAFDIGLITDSNFGSAEPLPQAYDNIKENLSAVDEIPIITGFIAKNEQGQITTLGRGGSDYTATIIGVAMNAEEIQIWTDVDGMMTTDPKVVKEAKTIDKICFNEAAELAAFGARVLHPKTILAAVKKNIPVRVLNSFNPSHEGTTILKEVKNSTDIVKSIALKKDVTLFHMKSTRMLLAHGFLARLFEVFNKHKVSIDMVSTSEVSVSLTVDNKNKDNVLDKIAAELKNIGKVTVEKNRSIVCLVGNGMKNTIGFLARVCSIIAKNNINIEMVSQGASEVNVGLLVDGKDSEKAVQCLHKEFFG